MTLIEAIIAMLDARLIYQERKCALHPWDWDVALKKHSENLKLTTDAFTAALNSHIDARIKEANK